MLHGVVMYVIHMSFHISFIPNLMFPETTLPDRRSALALSRCRQRPRIPLAACMRNVVFDL
ncbi:hypothetical protein MASSI9I_90063 [Massilia sp. 9I]|nr:hypothetical protein MASSI9I_90063 [Massilia sp. 9I]